MGPTIEWYTKEGEVEAKTQKLRWQSSVSGAPIEMAADGDEWRWCGDADEVVVVVVGRCIRKREARGGLGAENHETERVSSVSGAPCETVMEGDWGR